ncbi:hypothetical protein FNV43_RR10250 [Rhamnella rubrinervis]|uniref:Something about silencing protein 4 domain-containing protein n=1 Tax=Rhamnella rubrinervis TaxID=2594499 RepID=A0A8K0HBF9_9ROSA|nr:hypothetical protein FNV43_RR10250 [Rhamnella rubrinervis]
MAPSRRLPVRLSRATVYSDPSSASTPSFDSASSSVRVIDPNQEVEQNLVPHAEPNAGRDNLDEYRPRFFIQHLILINTDIPSIFTPEDMSYFKERLLYGEPTDPLWASYPATNMEKMKMRISIDAELAEKEWKKKEKRAAQKASGSTPSQDPKPTSGGTMLVQPKDLTVAMSAEKLPLRKRGMTFENISHKAEQWALKLEANLKREKKDEKLRNLRLDFLRIASERDDLQTQTVDWLHKKKIIYHKGVEDAFLKVRKQMIRQFKARETNWPSPEPSKDKGGNDESSEISSNEDEPAKNTEAEKTPSQTRDFFVEAMDLAKVDGA